MWWLFFYVFLKKLDKSIYCLYDGIRLEKGGVEMSDQKIVIQIRDNGSILVKGDVVLLDAEGNEYETKPAFSLCRCGHSSNKPFCDGTHKKIEFKDECRAK